MPFWLGTWWRLPRYCLIFVYGGLALERAVWPPPAHAPAIRSITSVFFRAWTEHHVREPGVNFIALWILRVLSLFIDVLSATCIGLRHINFPNRPYIPCILWERSKIVTEYVTRQCAAKLDKQANKVVNYGLDSQPPIPGRDRYSLFTTMSWLSHSHPPNG